MTLEIVKNIVPIDVRHRRRDALVLAMGAALASHGFTSTTPDLLAEVSGVPRKFIYKDFGGMEGLAAAFAWSGQFWPSASELIGEDEASLRLLPPDALIAAFFRRTLHALLARPQSLEIMAWESLERSALIGPLEDVRVRCALEFFELLEADPPESVDLTSIILLLAAAVQYLLVRSRTNHALGGVDLRSEEGWERINKAIGTLLTGSLRT